MRIVFSRIAVQELHDATHYYESEFQGLGKQFREEIRKAAIRISEYPDAWPAERGDIRKCLLHKFPYNLLILLRQIISLSLPLFISIEDLTTGSRTECTGQS